VAFVSSAFDEPDLVAAHQHFKFHSLTNAEIHYAAAVRVCYSIAPIAIDQISIEKVANHPTALV